MIGYFNVRSLSTAIICVCESEILMINPDGDLSFVPIMNIIKYTLRLSMRTKIKDESIEVHSVWTVNSVWTVHTGLQSFFASKSEISIFRSLFSRATEKSCTRTNLFSPMTASANLT